MSEMRLAEDILDSLLSKATRQRWPAGHMLAREGGLSDAVFYLLEGTVSVRKGETQLQHLTPGSLLGEMGVLTNQPRSADLVATTEIDVLRMEASDFLHAVDSHPAVMRAMIRDLCAKLDAMNLLSSHAAGPGPHAEILAASLHTERLREIVGLQTARIERPCWTRMGVWGDGSCQELAQHHHCRNCPVYEAAGRQLLDRPAPQGYLETWAESLSSDASAAEAGDLHSCVIFRLGTEWLALPTRLFKEATTPRACHRLPHRTNPVLRGLTNIRGELLPVFSLHALLSIEAASGTIHAGRRVYERFVVLEHNDGRWVAVVDEIAAIELIPAAAFSAVPSTVSGGLGTFARHLFTYHDQRVALLDDELIFFNLTRSFL